MTYKPLYLNCIPLLICTSNRDYNLWTKKDKAPIVVKVSIIFTFCSFISNVLVTFCFLSYLAINRGDVKDTEMEAIMDTIVDSLFSVFVTMGK